MSAVSSCRDINMKLLVFFAILACVYATPSHYAIPAHTITAGDIHATDIEARVKAENVERYIAEEAKARADELRRTGQAFWSGLPAGAGYIAGGPLHAVVPGYPVSSLGYQTPFRTYPTYPYGHVYPTVLKNGW